MLVSALIDSAAKKIGVLARGESLTTDENADCLLALQVMLRSWSADRISVFSSVHETYTLTADTASYTWGSGGTIDTLRPNKVIGASITESDVTYPVEVISEGKYRMISSKTTSARPYSLFPLYGFPYITIYLYPVPSTSYVLNLESLKPFTEASSFTATTDTIQVPVFYEEAIIYNLAIRLAPEFGVTIPIEVAKIADESYTKLKSLNSSNSIETIKISIPADSAGKYSINSDSYR